MSDLEKVIKGLRCCTSEKAIITSHENCYGCPYYGEGCIALALDALKLLEEHEAVKPILEQDSMVCGVCGHEVIWQKMLGDGIWADEELDYCPHCGRQVKWDDKW